MDAQLPGSPAVLTEVYPGEQVSGSPTVSAGVNLDERPGSSLGEVGSGSLNSKPEVVNEHQPEATRKPVICHRTRSGRAVRTPAWLGDFEHD